MEKCMCVRTHIWLIACLCFHVYLCFCHYIFSVPSILFFSHLFPSFFLLHSSSLLLFPSLFCKLGALARCRISLFGKGWCLFLHTHLCLSFWFAIIICLIIYLETLLIQRHFVFISSTLSIIHCHFSLTPVLQC